MRFLFLAAALFPLFAQAGASGVTFTQDEINSTLTNSRLISETAAACLQSTWNEHLAFFKANGYSKFYGSRKADYATAEGRKAAILRILPNLAKRVGQGDPAAIAELNRREAQLETTSCVGLAMKCTGQGFAAARMEATWDKIYSWLGRPDENGVPMYYGTDLQKALVDLGWKSLYWNPDVSQNAVWDQMDRQLNPLQAGKVWNGVWGAHAEHWAEVLNHHVYYGIPVQDIRTLVNFGITPSREFAKAPFFVGTAHAGYHVFPGFNGNVIEAHSVRDLGSIDNMQVGPFNPLNQDQNGVANGNGAPRWTRSEHYRSGVIVVPPGYIADEPYTIPPPAVGTPPNVPVPVQNPPTQPQQPKKCWFIFCPRQ
ncbi:MAG: hypothetical protein ACXVB9_06830 [Bdellovibrionota bacterium]